MADKQAMDAKKQKIMIVVVVVIFIFIIWQAIGMFGGGSTTPTITPSAAPGQQAMSGTAPGGAAKMGEASTQVGGSAATNTAMPQQASTPVVSASSNANNSTLQVDPALMNIQRENEAKYVKALNELQMLKIQREIAETNEAITKSKLDTVKSEQSISDILVKPAPTVVVPEGAYANNLVSPALAGQNISGIQNNRNAAPAAASEASYVVLSVSRQDQHWTAVLGNQGKLYSVNVGDNLPTDGSLVMSISKNAVVLKKDGVERKISISSAI